MEFLDTNASITISKFCRTAFLPRNAAESILADLVYLGLIEMIYEGKHFVYKLKKK